MRPVLGTVPEAAAAPPVANGGGAGHQALRGDGYSDTSMVIILVALLCALICALGLNSIVRCALRCGWCIAFETPEEEAARLAATGLKKKALRRIPVAVYGAEGANVPVAATECPICLGEFADGEKVRVLPKCNHGFHVKCIDTWLASHSSCPTCRHSLLDRTEDGSDGFHVNCIDTWHSRHTHRARGWLMAAAADGGGGGGRTA